VKLITVELNYSAARKGTGVLVTSGECVRNFYMKGNLSGDCTFPVLVQCLYLYSACTFTVIVFVQCLYFTVFLFV
jgi:hypothetical protein